MADHDDDLTWSCEEIKEREQWFKKYHGRTNINFLINNGMIPKHVYREAVIRVKTSDPEYRIIGFDGQEKNKDNPMTIEEINDLKAQDKNVAENLEQIIIAAQKQSREFRSNQQTNSSKIRGD